MAVPPGEIRLDAAARRLCRKCHALVLVGEADAAQRGQGMLRRCRRCDGLTLRAGAPIEGEVEGYGPGFEASAPMAVAHRFRCSQCRRSMVLLTPAGMLIAAVVAFMIGGVVHDMRGDAIGPILGAAFLALVALREVALRARHPTA